jgi:hypothetical protein
MQNAQIRASSMVMKAIQKDIKLEKFRQEFPSLISKLIEKELPADQRAVLPGRIYRRGYEIICQMHFRSNVRGTLILNSEMAVFANTVALF